MNKSCCVFLGLCVALSVMTGCAPGGGVTGPNPVEPVLREVTVWNNNNEVSRGGTLVFHINYTDLNANLNGGRAVIHDDRPYRYDSIVYDAQTVSGTLTVSITVDTWLSVGTHWFTIIVYDLTELQSNQVTSPPVTIK